jgi:hypothetical protein
MLLNKISFTIISASLLLSGIPAFAETTTTSNQITIINGSGNHSNSRSVQSVNDSNSGNNTGVSVKSKQVCDIVGNNNSCSSNSEQRVDNRRYHRQ